MSDDETRIKLTPGATKIVLELIENPPEPNDALLRAMAKRQVRLEPCPFCGTWQIQLIANYSNREHDVAKCRHCKATAKVSVWNERSEPATFPN